MPNFPIHQHPILRTLDETNLPFRKGDFASTQAWLLIDGHQQALRQYHRDQVLMRAVFETEAALETLVTRQTRDIVIILD